MALEEYLVRFERKGNPCQECARCIMNCPWLHEKRPVPGWRARIVGWRGQRSKWHTTYAIEFCPLYIAPSKKRLAKVKKTGQEYRSARTFY